MVESKYLSGHFGSNRHHINCICDLCGYSDEPKYGFTSCTCNVCDPGSAGYDACLDRYISSLDAGETKSVSETENELVIKSASTERHVIQIVANDDVFRVEVIPKPVGFSREVTFVLDLDEAMEEYEKLVNEFS